MKLLVFGKLCQAWNLGKWQVIVLLYDFILSISYPRPRHHVWMDLPNAVHEDGCKKLSAPQRLLQSEGEFTVFHKQKFLQECWCSVLPQSRQASSALAHKAVPSFPHSLQKLSQTGIVNSGFTESLNKNAEEEESLTTFSPEVESQIFTSWTSKPNHPFSGVSESQALVQIHTHANQNSASIKPWITVPKPQVRHHSLRHLCSYPFSKRKRKTFLKKCSSPSMNWCVHVAKQPHCISASPRPTGQNSMSTGKFESPVRIMAHEYW